MTNRLFTASTTASLQSDNRFETTGKSTFDPLTIMFQYLFTSEDSMKTKNKYLILFLQHHIQEKNHDLLSKFVTDSALIDLHISLLKSALIMTQRVEGIHDSIGNLQEVYNQKIPHH